MKNLVNRNKLWLVFIIPMAIAAFEILKISKSVNINSLIIHDLAKVKKPEQLNWIGHWKGEGKREQLVREIANEFEFCNQEISVNLKFPEDVYFNINNGNNSEIEFIINQIKSPSPTFDIIRLKDFYSLIAQRLNDPFWGKKYLVDFSEFPDFVKNQQPILFSEEYKLRNGGITIGPFNEGFFWALWFNKDVADKIGINIKQYGMTPNDLLEYIKAVYRYNKQNNASIIPIFEEANWTTSEILLMQMYYSKFSSMDELQKGGGFDPKRLNYLEEILKIFEEISKYEPTFKDRSKINWLNNADYILKGKCLFWTQGSWMYNIWEKNPENKSLLKKIYPAELPAFNGKSPCYIGGYKACWCVLKNAPHRENAIKLMKFWSRPEVAEKWARYTKCSTGIKGNLTSTTFGFDQYEDFIYNLNAKYSADKMLNADDRGVIFGNKNKAIMIPLMNLIENKTTTIKIMSDIKRQIKS